MNRAGILLTLSLLTILGLAFTSTSEKYLERGTISKIEYSSQTIKIGLEGGKTLILFTRDIISLKEGDLIEFKENKGFSFNKEELAIDQIWKINR